MPGGDEFAVLAGQRAVVDGEFHLDGRRINGDVGQGGARRNREGFADEHFLEAGDAHDVAGVGLLDLDAFHAFKMVDHGDLALGNAAMAVAADRRVAHLDLAS